MAQNYMNADVGADLYFPCLEIKQTYTSLTMSIEYSRFLCQQYVLSQTYQLD